MKAYAMGMILWRIKSHPVISISIKINVSVNQSIHWQYYSLFANGLELLNCVNHVIHLFTKNYSSKYTIDYKERRDLLIIFKSVLVGKGAANCQIFRKLRGISWTGVWRRNLFQTWKVVFRVIMTSSMYYVIIPNLYIPIVYCFCAPCAKAYVQIHSI